MQQRFLCKKCWLVFDKSAAGDSSSGKEISCPQCHSTNIMEAPAWVPLDSGRNIITGNEWSYECQDCKYQFRMPIPKSPEEDKSRKCPECKSGHLHLITGSKSLPLYCG